MTKIETEILQLLRQKINVLQQVRSHMEEKTLLLMTNQLEQLERSLPIDAELQETTCALEKQLQECRSRLADGWGVAIDELNWTTFSQRLNKSESVEIENIRKTIEQIVEDIHYINLKNLALIKNGQMFVETLLSAIWPSPTYERDKVGCFAPPSRFSMEC